MKTISKWLCSLITLNLLLSDFEARPFAYWTTNAFKFFTDKNLTDFPLNNKHSTAA